MLDEQLVAEGFVEAVTHTLVSEAVAAPFVPAGSALLRTIDDRDGGDTMPGPPFCPAFGCDDTIRATAAPPSGSSNTARSSMSTTAPTSTPTASASLWMSKRRTKDFARFAA